MPDVPVMKWSERFKSRSRAERYGAYTTKDLPRLDVGEIGRLSRQSGIHPDVLGPCRRAAARLNWVIMFRPINPAAMDHVGEFSKLPKPMAIKVKADPSTGLVKLPSQQALDQAIKDGKIDQGYAKKHALKRDPQGFLVNDKDQKFFSDMDLYEVLSGETGKQVRLGSGVSSTQGIGNRRELDTLINLLRPLGTSFGLIQHGPELQWIGLDSSLPNSERVTAFCPDGTVLILAANEVADFIRKMGA